MGKEIINNIFVNKAGGDNIVLAQDGKSGFVYFKELSHSCKDIRSGARELIDCLPDVQEMLRLYNSCEQLKMKPKKTDEDKKKV